MAMIGYSAQAQGSQLGSNTLNQPPELGMIERAACMVSSLKALHGKLGSFNDRLEGNGSAQAGQSVPTPNGLRSQLSEADAVLSACHSLLDDIAGKF